MRSTRPSGSTVTCPLPPAPEGGEALRHWPAGQPLKHIHPREPDWLWRPYVPLGGLTIVEGDPGTGKSTLLALLAAQVSNGWSYFRRPRIRPRGYFQSGTVVMCSLEDDAEAVIAPRLIAADADRDRVVVLDADFELDHPDGASRLDDVVGLHNPILLIIDPITSFMGRTDTHRSARVRSALKPMLKLARERGFAVVVSRHLVKSRSGRKIARGEGSLGGFTGQARSMLQVEEVEGERGLFRVEHIKSNYGKLGLPFHYRIEEVEVDLEPEDLWQLLNKPRPEPEVQPVSDIIRASRVAFVPVVEEPVVVVDDADSGRVEGEAREVRQPEREPTKTEQAVALLKELLATHGGIVSARQADEAAKERGLSFSNQVWAKVRKRLGVKQSQPTRQQLEDWGVQIPEGRPGHWWLPRERTADASPDDQMT